MALESRRSVSAAYALDRLPGITFFDLSSRDPRDMDCVADHVGGALLAILHGPKHLLDVITHRLGTSRGGTESWNFGPQATALSLMARILAKSRVIRSSSKS